MIKDRSVFEIYCSLSMVVTLNKWSSSLVRVCLKIGEDEAEDSERGGEKEVKTEHLTMSWDSVVIGFNPKFLLIVFISHSILPHKISKYKYNICSVNARKWINNMKNIIKNLNWLERERRRTRRIILAHLSLQPPTTKK